MKTAEQVWDERRDYDRLTPKERAAKRVVPVIEKWHIDANGEVDHHEVELAEIDSGTAAREQGTSDKPPSTLKSESLAQHGGIAQEESVDETVTDTRVSSAQVCRRCHHAVTQHHEGWADILNRPGCRFRGCPCKGAVK